ncbi:ABC transporter substrate-binding protein [Balneolaceae bacterium YR4-1]|uniref:ABC transporter substrate-binding protein n=1 Tax=Halalkalibaculum roseum TaxID=2709311 RepID=A0A6M1SZY8_9BACT|nr:ABC transporter substrate-binding protein [Halalkalibaculum roseum]NGP76794.1 ABC transporter substrate-binding protein [Halalkalibaculum roseum]
MKSSRNLFLLISLIIFSLSAINSSAAAQRDSTTVRELLEQRDQEIKDLVGPKGTEYTQERREKLKDIINGIIDYEAMASFALQETYDTLTTDQREEFVDLFATIIRDQSLNKLDIYRADVRYDAIKVNDDTAEVTTMVTLDDVRTPVIYDMKYDDQWVVTDMVIDDVSTAGSYRRQFQNIIRKKGYQSLLETLRKRASR